MVRGCAEDFLKWDREEAEHPKNSTEDTVVGMGEMIKVAQGTRADFLCSRCFVRYFCEQLPRHTLTPSYGSSGALTTSIYRFRTRVKYFVKADHGIEQAYWISPEPELRSRRTKTFGTWF